MGYSKKLMHYKTKISRGSGAPNSRANATNAGMIVGCNWTPFANCAALFASPRSPGKRTRSTPGRGFDAWLISRR